MTRWLRFGLTLLRSYTQQRLSSLDEELSISVRAWPTDSDMSVVNHAALISLMELGRIDLMARSGFLSLALRNGWSVPISIIGVRFVRPVRPLQRLTVLTKLAYADDQWLYVRHRIARGKKPVAAAVVQATVRKGRERISHQQVLGLLGLPYRWEDSAPTFDA